MLRDNKSVGGADAAVLYMRMSTDKQEHSIGGQRDVLMAFAKSHSFVVLREYRDEGISGRQAAKRPGFMQMIEDAALGEFDTVLIYDSSRFARNLEESLVYKSALKKQGVKILSATEPITDDEDVTLLTDALMGAVNEMFSRKLATAVKRGMIQSAKQGKHLTPPPFGYKKVNGELERNETEAPIVKRIFELFIELKTYMGVSIRLNEDHIQKRSASAWRSADIKRMLRNEVYIGNVLYDGIIYKGRHEAIIDSATYAAAKEVCESRPKNAARAATNYKHWLSGLLRCGVCGGRMNYKTDGRKYAVSYICSNYTNGASPYANIISVARLECLVKTALAGMIDSAPTEDYEFIPGQENKRVNTDSRESALRRVRAKLERHKAAYAGGIDTLEEYKANKAACANEESKINTAIARVNNAEAQRFKKTAKMTLEILFSDEYGTEEKSAAVMGVIDRIVVNRQTGEFTLFYFI